LTNGNFIITTTLFTIFLFYSPHLYGSPEKDDTDSLQIALNLRHDIKLNRTYVINRTLIIPAGVSIHGGVIKNGNHMTGTLLSNGIFLKYEETDSDTLNGVRFEINGNFELGNWGNAVVLVKNARHLVVTDCVFLIKQKYNRTGVEAIWITGNHAYGNIIAKNKVFSGGIEYAENGASDNLVKDNYIEGAHSDALSGHGNSAFPCKKNKLINNTILNAGFMGIEDWGNCDGTVISGNNIKGTGKDPGQNKEGIGISAVGINTIVSNNIIEDAKLYYIETGGNHNIRTTQNKIIDRENKSIGIIANFTSSVHFNLARKKNTITRNAIYGTREAIQVFGKYVDSIRIDSNQLRNSYSKGINVDTDSKYFIAEVTNNMILFENKPVVSRIAILTYTRLAASSNQEILIKDNIVTYKFKGKVANIFDYCFMIAAGNANIRTNMITTADNNVVYLFHENAKLKGPIVDANKVNGTVNKLDQ
jgi:hypothetical protein